MSNVIAVETFERLADEVNGDVRYDYSGRSMYGRECMGITVDQDNFMRVIELAGSMGIFGATYDSMGMGMIVYWPKYQEKNLPKFELND